MYTHSCTEITLNFCMELVGAERPDSARPGVDVMILTSLCLDDVAVTQRDEADVVNADIPDTQLEEDECCACGHAMYSVTFQGLWSRQTHPKQFPDAKRKLIELWQKSTPPIQGNSNFPSAKCNLIELRSKSSPPTQQNPSSWMPNVRQ